MTRVILVTILLAAAGGGVAWWSGWFGSSAAGATQDDGGLYATRRGDLRITIIENGTLMAKDSVKVALKSRWQGKIASLLEEGTEVKEGQELCKMDTKELEQRREQLELEIVQSESSLKAAKTELEIQINENAANIEKAQIALEKAKLEQEKYRDGDAPKEKRQLDIAIKNAATTHARATKKFEDSKALMEKNFIKKTELEDHQLEYERSVVELEGAKLDLTMFETYTLPMSLRDKQTAVGDAERSLDSTTKRAETLLNGKQVAVTQSEKRLDRNKEQLKDINENIEKMTLYAPVPGILLYGDPKSPWSRENIKVGGDVWGDNTVFTIPDLRVMQVMIQVHEAEISKVVDGLEARVTMDTYPGLVLQGKVSRIAQIANSSQMGSSSSAVKKFDVLITLSGADELKLKPGISAKAEVHIADLKDVLYVPMQAVFLEDGLPFVNVHVGTGKHEKRQVELGLSNDSYSAILKGLEEGEKVLLYNPEIGKERKDDKGEPDKAAEAAPQAGPPGNGPPPGRQN